jgi:hypothetical protein
VENKAHIPLVYVLVESHIFALNPLYVDSWTLYGTVEPAPPIQLVLKALLHTRSNACIVIALYAGVMAAAISKSAAPAKSVPFRFKRAKNDPAPRMIALAVSRQGLPSVLFILSAQPKSKSNF